MDNKKKGIRDNFKIGAVEMLVLALLYEQDLYGYQISQQLAERSNEVIHVPSGSLYPTLYALEENNYVSTKEVLVKKRMTRIYYHIEEKGIERLMALKENYERTNSGIQNIFLTSPKFGREKT